VLTRTNDAFLTEDRLLANRRDQAHDEANIDAWMRSRRLSWPGMTQAVIRAHGQRIVSMLDAGVRETGGREFDVAALLRHHSARMVADFLLGPDAEDVVTTAAVRNDRSEPFMDTNLTIPKWLPTPAVRRLVRAQQDNLAAITVHVRHRRTAPHRPPEDLLDLLVAGPAETSLTDDQITDLFASTMLASFGSPGAVLAWIVLELARHPEIYQRVRGEAGALLADTGTVLDDSRLPYCTAFVKETLRLYPPTWLMGRRVHRPYTLGGWTLRPGQQVRFSPYLTHRDPRWWPDPDELRVDRWLDPAPAHPRRAYFPFGAGPRICVGLHLGMYQMVTSAAHLATHYQIVVADQDITASTGPVLLPEGLTARLLPTAS
jgi:cytochrome P450